MNNIAVSRHLPPVLKRVPTEKVSDRVTTSAIIGTFKRQRAARESEINVSQSKSQLSSMSLKHVEINDTRMIARKFSVDHDAQADNLFKKSVRQWFMEGR